MISHHSMNEEPYNYKYNVKIVHWSTMWLVFYNAVHYMPLVLVIFLELYLIFQSKCLPKVYLIQAEINIYYVMIQINLINNSNIAVIYLCCETIFPICIPIYYIIQNFFFMFFCNILKYHVQILSLALFG